MNNRDGRSSSGGGNGSSTGTITSERTRTSGNYVQWAREERGREKESMHTPVDVVRKTREREKRTVQQSEAIRPERKRRKVTDVS